MQECILCIKCILSEEKCKMFESFDEFTFQGIEPIPSATPVLDTLQGAVQGTVSECKDVQGYSIEQIMSICSIAR